MPNIKVAIVEDQQATREGLAILISNTPGFEVTGRFASMEQALDSLDVNPPHVLLMDIELPGMSGIEGVRLVRSRLPRIQILMLTVYGDDDHVFEAICAGACGYLLKGIPRDKLLAAIREMRDGGAPMSPEIARKIVLMFQKVAPPRNRESQLTPREFQILKLLADGHNYKTCADQLSLSLHTVRFHIRNIYEQLHVHSKSEAVLKALRSGLIS
ncbi:MAG: response regulator transcription factor [Acidobacteriia bacterium]|nr:response regulator transcription factor [Terriglobia bacterium]